MARDEGALAKSPATTIDVLEALAPTTNWKLKTVLTLLNRLVKKGAVGFRQTGAGLPLLSAG